ncbi:MAG TPA: transposase [Eudoraea sp.]|nr:transposase [Eudoraea sp.]
MNHPLCEQFKEICSDLPAHALNNLLTVAQCMCLARSTNLAKAKDYVSQVLGYTEEEAVQPQSHYRRLTRFFDQAVQAEQDGGFYYALTETIHHLTLGILGGLPKDKPRKLRVLLLDGTKWEVRGEKVQFLTLAMLHQGVALPLYADDLLKAGHSSQVERIAFFRRVEERFDLRHSLLLGDREYVGIQWFATLYMEFGIHFVIRLKKGIYHQQIDAAPGKTWEQMQQKLRDNKKKKRISKPITLGGVNYRYVITRNPKAGGKGEDEFLYLLTTLSSAETAISQYALRWQIEVLFRHLKSNGFDLESTRVEGKYKREVMMQMLCLVYLLAIREGLLFYQRYPKARQVKMDYARKVKTLVHSVFRQGLCILMQRVASLDNMIRYLASILAKANLPKWGHV